MLTEKELCGMCNDYSIDYECEKKDSCRLLSIVRDNKKLSKENKELKKNMKMHLIILKKEQQNMKIHARFHELLIMSLRNK